LHACCWFRGEDLQETKIHYRYYPQSGENKMKLCESCAALLDTWGDEGWDKFYEEQGAYLEDLNANGAHYAEIDELQHDLKKGNSFTFCPRCGNSSCICADSRL
jgi:ribosomal protein S27AE